ncbi:PREDICTED: probable receptor-like serine/threonine-protein kinase At5g57670 [Ipomoea nil]|uniref:probable receptor-like serine/threonine-protein kinase At5g57670 n=1 Tax=Ipomoea nil TaxID=35883 RepID=UPI0009014811|nr:PREDICTED: probable receptor-like serine/threonine-protein kinase At5g57670 [Ipomoea nil]
MKLTGNCAAAECTANSGSNGGAVVVVGVKMDSRSKELLTWALVKVAQTGDRIIALHVLDPDTDKSEMLRLVKTFDSVLAAYEGFCNLKQVDLKLRVCRGSPARKILAREAKTYRATDLIVGTSGSRHAVRSPVSVAKYCARNVDKSISVLAVNNGKVAFQSEPNVSIGHEFCPQEMPESSRFKRRKMFTKSPLGAESNSLALVPVRVVNVPETKSGWTLLRRVFLQTQKDSGNSPAKKLSVVQWVLKLRGGRQSFPAIYPDQKQIISGDPECHSDENNGAIVPVPSHAGSLISKELEGVCAKYSSVCRLFSYQELLSATSNFMSENLIGKGGSSNVYKGCLPDGKELAVKILKPSEDLEKQFCSEIETLTALHHENIISLFGFCLEENNLLLVYDLLSRGSLEDNLHGTRNVGGSFGWQDRYKVALGVAKALDHLHNSTNGPVIHRDVKSSNILLSNDFEPKLSDFGLATSASSSSFHLDGVDVAGTFGYLAPEYFVHGKINEKIDVYALGVVLLELLSGKKPIDNTNAKGQESLVLWAKQILKNGKATELLDASLLNAYDHDEFDRMVLAATLCIRREPIFRPKIDIVVKLLEGEPETIQWARQNLNSGDEVDEVGGEQPASSIQSFINLALLNLEDDSLSITSSDQNISVDDYLRGRWSRSSSFD